MKLFRPATKRIEVSVGESVRIIRELQGYSQNELARRTNIPQATLSAIENGRVRLGVERAKVLARALKCHPAVLVFPGCQFYAIRRHSPFAPTRSPAPSAKPTVDQVARFTFDTCKFLAAPPAALSADGAIGQQQILFHGFRRSGVAATPHRQ